MRPGNLQNCYFATLELSRTLGIFFFGSSRVELRAVHFLSRFSTTWATPPSLLALVTFEVGFHDFIQACLDHDPLISFSQVARIAGVRHHAQTSHCAYSWWQTRVFRLLQKTGAAPLWKLSNLKQRHCDTVFEIVSFLSLNYVYWGALPKV
jgi:hypothetical protein